MIFRSFYGWKNRAEPLLNSKETSASNTASRTPCSASWSWTPHLAVCFDAKGKTFGHEMFTDYSQPPPPAELKETIPRVIEMVRRMGVPLLMTSGVEGRHHRDGGETERGARTSASAWCKRLKISSSCSAHESGS